MPRVVALSCIFMAHLEALVLADSLIAWGQGERFSCIETGYYEDSQRRP
jgi:hypothetical protein